MTIKYTNDLAIFEGACRLNEAEPLYEWLKQNPNGKLDLTDCTHIHTAIMQIILLAKPLIVAGPADGKHWFASIGDR